MNSQSKKDDNPIKVEKLEFDSTLTTSVQGSTINEECFHSSDLDSNSRKIKVEADYDDNENKRDFLSKCFDGIKTECFEDGEDGSAKKAISMSNVITIPNMSNPAKVLKRESSSTKNKETNIDGNESIFSSLQQGRHENSDKRISMWKRLCEDTDANDRKEARCPNENKEDMGTRRNPARSKRINYKEADSSEDDDSLFCEECQLYTHRGCLIHGPREDTCSDEKRCNAMNVLPPNISIKESSLPDVGLGVFALQEIPIGTQFGPYKGRKIVRGAMDESTDTRYMREIMNDRKISHYVDDKMDSKRNWMRYINCSRTEAEQNLVAFQYENEIYYRALKTIKINDELLVWYDNEYASGLGKIWDDLSSEETACKESTRSNETNGNRQHCYKKKVEIDHVSCIIVNCQNCRKTYSARSISLDNREPVEFLCNSCNSMKQSSTRSDCFSEELYSTKSTDLKPQLAVGTMTETINLTRNFNALDESTQICIKSKTSTTEGMTSDACYEDMITLRRMDAYLEKATPCQIVKTSKNDKFKRDNTQKKQCHREMRQSSCKQVSSVKRHVRTLGKKPHKCKICQYAFSSLGDLKKHMRTHTGEKPYKCEICPYACNQSSSLTVHMKIHRGEKPYKCEICQYASYHVGSLRIHIRTHSGEKPYKCEVCQYASSQLGCLKAHMRTHNGEKPYKCEICQSAFSQSYNLKKHMRTHSGEKPYKCEICQYAFRHLSTLKSHMRTHSGEKPYKCEICQYASSYLGHLKEHRRIHNGEKPYKCEICQSAFSRLGNLKMHMRTHSGEKPYKCGICQNASSQLANFKEHMRTHSGEKPYKCELCQYASSHLAYLKRHMRIHTGEKPYKCEICQFAFSQLGSLTSHMRTHNGERPYKCKICQYAFSQSSSLSTHMRIHTGEKPYKCDICQHAFNQSSTLKGHMRIHSGEKPYKCEICSSAFRLSGNFKKHMRIHSSEDP